MVNLVLLIFSMNIACAISATAAALLADSLFAPSRDVKSGCQPIYTERTMMLCMPLSEVSEVLKHLHRSEELAQEHE